MTWYFVLITTLSLSADAMIFTCALSQMRRLSRIEVLRLSGLFTIAAVAMLFGGYLAASWIPDEMTKSLGWLSRSALVVLGLYIVIASSFNSAEGQSIALRRMRFCLIAFSGLDAGLFGAVLSLNRLTALPLAISIALLMPILCFIASALGRYFRQLAHENVEAYAGIILVSLGISGAIG